MKESSFDFATWARAYDKDVGEFKNSLAFMFDSIDETRILVKLFVESDSNQFQGTNTIGWIEYDFSTKTLSDSIQETQLQAPQNLAKELEACLRDSDL